MIVADRESLLDSDEEFIKDFYLIVDDDIVVDYNDIFVDEVLSMFELSIIDLFVEVRFFEGIILFVVN